ncbi:hypothetical protein LCGC14_0273900 [marine sediment metagenome]|uniref:Uncharacterized protein n=2 Tax=root TaxID=1 RepID=A0A9C9NJ75_9HYPH|nr:hypothetical protein [Aurantimonas coralicida]
MADPNETAIILNVVDAVDKCDTLPEVIAALVGAANDLGAFKNIGTWELESHPEHGIVRLVRKSDNRGN